MPKFARDNYEKQLKKHQEAQAAEQAQREAEEAARRAEVRWSLVQNDCSSTSDINCMAG